MLFEVIFVGCLAAGEGDTTSERFRSRIAIMVNNGGEGRGGSAERGGFLVLNLQMAFLPKNSRLHERQLTCIKDQL